MNQAFADGFNARSMDDLMSLYEAQALVQGSPEGAVLKGNAEIRQMLSALMELPGRMTAINHFCLQCGELALLRADWHITDEAGHILASGSSAEVLRQQPEGHWLYCIDHAVGSSLARVDGLAR
nr:nuclear transport factor 2 family protein [Herbaspirillum sp. 1130]